MGFLHDFGCMIPGNSSSAGCSPPDVATATANFTQTISQNTDQTCNNSQVTNEVKNTIAIASIDCANISIGNITAQQAANCQMTTNLSALAKVMADQKASATNSGGGGATSGDQVNVQQSIEQNMAASCSAQQNTSITGQVLTIGDVKGSACTIGSINASQNSICVMDMQAQASTGATVIQMSTASSTNFFQQALMMLAAIAVVFLIVIGLIVILGVRGHSKSKTARALAEIDAQEKDQDSQDDQDDDDNQEDRRSQHHGQHEGQNSQGSNHGPYEGQNSQGSNHGPYEGQNSQGSNQGPYEGQNSQGSNQGPYQGSYQGQEPYRVGGGSRGGLRTRHNGLHGGALQGPAWSSGVDSQTVSSQSVGRWMDAMDMTRASKSKSTRTEAVVLPPSTRRRVHFAV